jgi:hypothetical protein
MIGDTVGARKASKPDDFFVVDPFTLEPRLLRMGNVPLAGY